MFVMSSMTPEDEKKFDKKVETNNSKKYYSQWSCFKVSYLNCKIRFAGRAIQKMCGCLRMDRKERMLYKNNLRQLEKEFHVTYQIQTIRMLKAAMRTRFTETEWNSKFRKFKRLDGHYSDASEDDFESNDQKQNIMEFKAETLPVLDCTDIAIAG